MIIGGSQAIKKLVSDSQTRRCQNRTSSEQPDTTMASTNGFPQPEPTLAMSSNQTEERMMDGQNTNGMTNEHATNGFGDASNGFGDWLLPQSNVPSRPESIAGRKRSRSDIFSQDDEDSDIGDGSMEMPSLETLKRFRAEQECAEGMSLSHAEHPGYEPRPGSQGGPWVEAGQEHNPFHAGHQKRPSVSTRKSQRVDSTASKPDDLAQLVLPPNMREATAEPLIDEATRLLGISWTRMDATEVSQISQAAYSKWIINHYPNLRDARVWFENSAIPGYLVAAQNAYSSQEEYYIFSHNLTEARLITSDPAQLVPRLQMLPALELAAPGGHIQAEKDVSPVEQTVVEPIQPAPAPAPASALASAPAPSVDDDMELMRMGMLMQAGVFRGFCSADDMEMD